MISAVLCFAALSILFELLMLLKFAPLNWLNNRWFVGSVHILVTGINLAIHFGTIVGTMTAITAALASFMTVPMALWLKIFWKHWKSPRTINGDFIRVHE